MEDGTRPKWEAGKISRCKLSKVAVMFLEESTSEEKETTYMGQFDWRDLRRREQNDAPPSDPPRRGVRTKCTLPSAIAKESEDAQAAAEAKENAQALAEAKEPGPENQSKSNAAAAQKEGAQHQE